MSAVTGCSADNHDLRDAHHYTVVHSQYTVCMKHNDFEDAHNCIVVLFYIQCVRHKGSKTSWWEQRLPQLRNGTAQGDHDQQAAQS